MKVIFSWKFSKFDVDFQNAIKLGEDVDGFKDNYVWTGCRSFIWSSVNVVKKCPKISDPTKRHDTQLDCFDINGTLG